MSVNDTESEILSPVNINYESRTLVIGPTKSGKTHWFSSLEAAFDEIMEGKDHNLNKIVDLRDTMPALIKRFFNIENINFEVQPSKALKDSFDEYNRARSRRKNTKTTSIVGTMDTTVDNSVVISRSFKNRKSIFPIFKKTTYPERYEYFLSDVKGGAAMTLEIENIHDDVIADLREADNLIVCFDPSVREDDGLFDEKRFELEFAKQFENIISKATGTDESNTDDLTPLKLRRIIFVATKADNFFKSMAERMANRKFGKRFEEVSDENILDAIQTENAAFIQNVYHGLFKYMNKPLNRKDTVTNINYSLYEPFCKHIKPILKGLRRQKLLTCNNIQVGFSYISVYGFRKDPNAFWHPNISENQNEVGNFSDSQDINPMNVLAPLQFCTMPKVGREFGIEIFDRMFR